MKKEKNRKAEYYFHEGTNFRAYEFLGCHAEECDGRWVYSFRTWAPRARAIFVVGDAFGWETGIAMQRTTERGLWEVFFESDRPIENTKYKYRILAGGGEYLKGDPYAFFSEGGSGGASIILHGSEFCWEDENWIRYRQKTVTYRDGNYLSAPIHIYEVHLGSFMRRENGSYLSYRELAEKMVPYVKKMGYTHIELMPVTEHPYDGSWGYQVCGYFAPTSRYGSPDDFRYFVNAFHTAGVGVLLDWVPAHFPKDAWGLYEFDGGPLYEYQGWDRIESRSWGTRFFDLGREEIQSFLISSALFWLREYHIDGLRVDAVASMIYLDYDRGPGEWYPNVYGNNHNLEAIAFLQKLNQSVFKEYPDALMIAEESTAWQGVTHPVSGENLGFNLKWNMGWANDFFDYLATDPVFRKYHHYALNFPIVYAFGENYVLPISHDEVVYGKRSFLDKMHGDFDRKQATFRVAMLLMMTFPGKKLTFMGTEFGQLREWNYEGELDWFLLEDERHRALRDYVGALNRFYLHTPALWEQDFKGAGFSWVYADEAERNMVAYRRHPINGKEILVLISFSGADSGELRVPVEQCGRYEILFHTFAYPIATETIPVKEDATGHYISLHLPPMSGMVLRAVRNQNSLTEV